MPSIILLEVYISWFADIAAPLHAFTRKGASFAWIPEWSEATDTLKDSLVCAPVLGYPRFGADVLNPLECTQDHSTRDLELLILKEM